jgi:uncharacterized protein YjbJ (UPF0337 family)
MSAEDEAKNTAGQATGKVRQGAGKVTGDEPLEAEGRSGQAKGNIRQAPGKTEDAFTT